MPQHPGALSDLAYTELRLRRYDYAYQHYMQAIKASGSNVNTNLYDGLTEVCHHLNKKKKNQIWAFSHFNKKNSQRMSLL